MQTFLTSLKTVISGQNSMAGRKLVTEAINLGPTYSLSSSVSKPSSSTIEDLEIPRANHSTMSLEFYADWSSKRDTPNICTFVIQKTSGIASSRFDGVSILRQTTRKLRWPSLVILYDFQEHHRPLSQGFAQRWSRFGKRTSKEQNNHRRRPYRSTPPIPYLPVAIIIPLCHAV